MIEFDLDFEDRRSQRVLTERREERARALNEPRIKARRAAEAAENVARRARGRSEHRKARRARLSRLTQTQCESCAWTPPAGHESVLHVHHITPLSCGGSHDDENLVVLCPNCHAIGHRAWRIERLSVTKRAYEGPTTRQAYLDGLPAASSAVFSATTPKKRREVKRAK